MVHDGVARQRTLHWPVSSTIALKQHGDCARDRALDWLLLQLVLLRTRDVLEELACWSSRRDDSLAQDVATPALPPRNHGRECRLRENLDGGDDRLELAGLGSSRTSASRSMRKSSSSPAAALA